MENNLIFTLCTIVVFELLEELTCQISKEQISSYRQCIIHIYILMDKNIHKHSLLPIQYFSYYIKTVFSSVFPSRDYSKRDPFGIISSQWVSLSPGSGRDKENAASWTNEIYSQLGLQVNGAVISLYIYA